MAGPNKTNPVFNCSKCGNILAWRVYNTSKNVWYLKTDYGEQTMNEDGTGRKAQCKNCQHRNLEPIAFKNS